MPRSVFHSSTKYGVLGLLDLDTKQGCGQVSMIYLHLRYNQCLHNPIISLIESFTFLSGSVRSPLEETSSFIYIQSPWMQTLLSFLYKNNTKTEISNLQTLHLLRKYDQPIICKKNKAEMVSACRLCLQVTKIAEISQHNSTTMLDCDFYGRQSEDHTPSLHLYSTSNLNWPVQMDPPIKACQVWRKYLLNFVHRTRVL
jgi:hypothetical protein